MYIYVLILIMIIAASFLDVYERTDRIPYVIYAIFCFFYILRARIGTDWITYEYFFSNIFDPSVVKRFGFEYGYYLLNLMIYRLGLPFQSIPIIISIFVCILFYKAVRAADLYMGITLLAALFFMFYPTLEALRQSIPVFLFFYLLSIYSPKLITKDKQTIIENVKSDRKYWIVCAIGVLFHQTCIIVAILYYCFQKHRILKITIAILILSFGVLQPQIERLMSIYLPNLYHKYIYYTIFAADKISSSLFSYKFIEYIVACIILLFLKNKTTIEATTLNLIELGIIIQIAMVGKLAALYRILYYTDIGIVLFVGIIAKRIENKHYIIIYYVLIAVIISIHILRVFPIDNPLFTYHMLW